MAPTDPTTKGSSDTYHHISVLQHNRWMHLNNLAIRKRRYRVSGSARRECDVWKADPQSRSSRGIACVAESVCARSKRTIKRCTLGVSQYLVVEPPELAGDCLIVSSFQEVFALSRTRTKVLPSADKPRELP
jgi:hypothetical protein